MRKLFFLIFLFSIIESLISHNLIPQESGVRPWGYGEGQGGGGPWNPPLPRSRGFTRPPTPRPRTPRHQPDNGDYENISYDDQDYPVRRPISLRHHRPRSRYPVPRPSFDSEQAPYPIYPKLMRANSIGESKISKFENTPGPAPSPKPATVKNLGYPLT